MEKDPKDMSFAELNAMADKGELTQDMMEQVLQSYAASVREEFEMATTTDPSKFEEAARDFGRKHGGEALAQIHYLMHHASSETVQMNAAKFIVTLAKDESTADGDPIKVLLEELSGNSSSAS